MPRLALVSLLLAAGALLPSRARAADSWSYPHPGLALLERTTSTPWRIYALKLDLCARGVSLRATTESERHQTPSSFMSAVGAQAAINGDFFNYTDYFPVGLAVGAGTLWHADNATMGYVGFGPDHAQLSRTTEVLADKPWWMLEAVGGYPTLVENGVALSSFSPAPDHCSSRNPRTAVGLSHDRQQLWMVVVDGRSSASAGMTCRELALLMQDLGAWSALNLDGGGSSALTIAGRGTVNAPSDGSERSVSNHLAVFASGSGAPGSCALWLDEVLLDAAALADDATDLDGDGRADLCARAAAGLLCYPSRGGSFGEAWVIDSLSDASGWDDETNFSTLRLGDVTGDGLADVCARGNARVYCWPSTGSGFGPYIDGPALSDDAGWNRIDRFSTLRLPDFNGDGDVGTDKDITFYQKQLAERSQDGKMPPYMYAVSQIGHEMGHRWSAFVNAKVDGKIIPLAPTHWDQGLQAPAAYPYQRPTEASIMGGGVWQDNFDGTFTQLDDNYYVPATGWSYLDLYLMGFVTPEEVPDFFLLRNLAPVGKDANGHRIFKADRIKVTIQDVIAAEGPRKPDVDHSQRKFNTGMVMVVEHSAKPSPELIERTKAIGERWIDYFETTTGHRASMTTTVQ
jgi:hypothetical protein